MGEMENCSLLKRENSHRRENSMNGKWYNICIYIYIAQAGILCCEWVATTIEAKVI